MKSKYKDYIFYLVSSVIAVAGYIIISSYLNAMREVVKIENIKKGELIYSYNLLTEEIELKPVLEVLKTYNQGNTLKLKFKENVEIETTFNHEFMTSDGEWITAEELELETKVCTITGERISLEAKEIVRNVNPN